MKYKDQEGNYLVVAESGYRLAWFIVEWNDYGLFLGGKERTPTDPLERKMLQIADEFAEGRDVTGFFFGSGSKARAALKAINDALVGPKKDRPYWAIKADAAGWKPPKGWKP